MTTPENPDVDSLVDRLSALRAVRAVVMTGSRASGSSIASSDVDLFVYVDGDVLDDRGEIAAELGDQSAAVLVDVSPFGSIDVWRGSSGLWFDILYWTTAWAEDQLDRVLIRHEASLGYTTAFWRSIATATSLYERDDWHPELRERARSPYPAELTDAIVSLNYPWLTDHPFSFRHQLETAVARRDRVSINHRLAAWIGSYFDVVFAVNRVLHPGEKRQLEFAEAECRTLPTQMRSDVEAALDASDPMPPIDRLVDGLRAIL